jgi:hypothetical protein
VVTEHGLVSAAGVRCTLSLRNPAASSHAAGTFRKQTMTTSKAVVIAVLRERGPHGRAGFVDRKLPDRIDPSRHGG